MAHLLWRDVEHGDLCSCRLLAPAVGTVDFACCGEPAPPATPRLPPLEVHDPVQAAILADLRWAP